MIEVSNLACFHRVWTTPLCYKERLRGWHTGVVMRVFVVCAVVAAGFLYYMMQQDATYKVSGANPNSTMAKCIDEKTGSPDNSYADYSFESLQNICAGENNLRLVNGEWVER